ncbi:MAG TPA: hypothetical protein VGM24_03995 [Puia sp.]
MMRYSTFLLSAVILFLGFTACKKSDKSNSSRTVANISGTYVLTALTAGQGGASFNVYDSLPACEKDNKIVLEASGNAQFIDAGPAVCSPSSDSTGSWHLSAGADSIYLGDEAAYIKSFDGKTLVVTNSQEFSGLTLVATTTLTKE